MTPLVLKGVGALLEGKLGNLRRRFSLIPVTGGGVDSHDGKQGHWIHCIVWEAFPRWTCPAPHPHPSLTSECPVGHTCR